MYDISLTRLLSECEKAKIALSNPGIQEAEIDIDGYFRFLNGQYQRMDIDDLDEDESNVGENSNIVITKEKFEELIRTDLMTTISITKQCIQNCGISVNDINRVLLVGGSSSIPYIRKLLGETFGSNKVVSNINAQLCVSQGSALRGFMNITEKNTNAFIERCAYDIALKTSRGFTVLIPAGTKFPYTNHKVYKLPEDNTGTIFSDIYEYVDGNYELVKNLVLSSDDIAYQKVRVTVDFKITTSGELTVRYINNANDEIIQEEKLVIDQ